MISAILLDGFKSFRTRHEIALRPLTVLAGCNGAGKSSALQPLLLLKQTADVGYDPGPLHLSGPNVEFSKVEQMLWTAPGQAGRREFSFGLRFSAGDREIGVEVTYAPCARGLLPLEIEACVWTLGDVERRLTPQMTAEQIVELVGREAISDAQALFEDFEPKPVRLTPEVHRDGSVLVASVKAEGPDGSALYFPICPERRTIWFGLNRVLSQVIHVPALRGNPRRTYPVSAVGMQFSGVFNDYVASVVASWASDKDARLEQLGSDLASLGLTWKVSSKRVDDTKVELRVGRLPRSRRGGSRDLVSVADAGFGVGQVLPVAVALAVADSGYCVYLEQPEIHLHPRAQVRLAEIIARAVGRGVQVVVETHSELLLLGIQKLVADGSISPNEVMLHWFTRDSHGATRVASADMDEAGCFGEWPVDFADVSMDTMRSYLQASLGSEAS